MQLVGDVMADVSLAFAPIARERSTALEDLGLEPGVVPVVATAHRAGNVDDPARLERLVALLEALPATCVLPLHPRTARGWRPPGCSPGWKPPRTSDWCAPLGYLDFLRLTWTPRRCSPTRAACRRRRTCSGVRCVTLRDTTEWVETVQAGWNVLVDLDAAAALPALERPPPPAERPELYGGGHAAERIGDVPRPTLPGDEVGVIGLGYVGLPLGPGVRRGGP